MSPLIPEQPVPEEEKMRLVCFVHNDTAQQIEIILSSSDLPLLFHMIYITEQTPNQEYESILSELASITDPRRPKNLTVLIQFSDVPDQLITEFVLRYFEKTHGILSQPHLVPPLVMTDELACLATINRTIFTAFRDPHNP
jgi:hypothetical protein